MVIVAQGTGWWIEAFHIARSALTTDTTSTTTLTLERTGVFIGGSCAIDCNGSQLDLVSTELSNDGTTQLVQGDLISSVICIRANRNASTRTLGAHVILFMRKSL